MDEVKQVDAANGQIANATLSQPETPAREKYSSFQIAGTTVMGAAFWLGAEAIWHWATGGGKGKRFSWKKPTLEDKLWSSASALVMGAVFGVENYVDQTKEILEGKNRKITHLERVLAEKDALMGMAQAKR